MSWFFGGIDMNYREFLANKGKKILIANKVSVGNACRRMANTKDEINTVDVTTKTISQIALEVVQADKALQGDYSGVKVLDSDSATFLLANQLRENPPSFISKPSLSIATINQLYKSISVIRSSVHKDIYTSAPSEHISELQRIIKEYDEMLSEEKLYDNPRVLNEAIKIVSDIESNSADLGMDIDFYLPWINGALIGCLETNRLTSLEEFFLNKLVQLGTATKKEIVCILPEGGFDAWKANEKVDKHFVRAYGAVNEIENAVKEILRLRKEGISLDQVNIYYTSTDYENFLRGALDMAHIPYSMDRGIKASGTGIVQIMLRMLDWAESGYNYEKLKPIILNNILTFKRAMGEEESIYCNPNKEYVNASATIGWGAGRYIEFYDDASNNDQEARFVYATFLIDMLNVFMDTADKSGITERTSIAEIYEKMLSFVRKYTSRGNEEWISVSVPLSAQIEVFKYLNSDGLDNKDRFDYIRSFLNRLMVSQVGVDKPCVSVKHVDGFRLIESKYVFILGMSATKFAVNSVNSAILSDEDMEKYLEGDYLPLTKEANQLRTMQLQETLSTMVDGYLSMSYSCFDTINLRENCASVFFLDMCDDNASDLETNEDTFKNITHYDCFGIDSKDFNLDDRNFREWLETWTKKAREDALKAKEEALNAKEDAQKPGTYKEEKPAADNRTYISASQLQNLLSCPLKYYYETIRKIKIDEPAVKLPYQWMPATARGNLYHRTYERFMDAFFPPAKPMSAPWNDAVDSVELRKIFDSVVDEIKGEVPPAPDYIMNREIEENWACALEYMKRLVNVWYEDATKGKIWHVLGCELDFVDEIGDEIVYKDKDVNYPYVLQFARGSIDRLDGYVDDKSTLHLRITDYKTGSVSHKIKEIETDKWIQHHVYAMAAIVYVNNPDVKKKLIKQFGVSDIKAVTFDNILYSFPTSVLESAKREDMEIDVLQDSLYNNMPGQNQLVQDTKNPMLWHVDFSEGVKEILRYTIGILQKINLEKEKIAEPDETGAWADTLLDLEKTSERAVSAYISSEIAELTEESPWNKNKVNGGFCDYCKFVSICRRHAGDIPFTGKVSDTEIDTADGEIDTTDGDTTEGSDE